MSEPTDTDVLEEILEALEHGRDLAPIRAAYPERADAVERWIAAAGRYARSLRALSGRGAPDVPRLAPGERLGDFEVELLLARGGEGEVYRARQRSLGGRRVALKVVPAEGRTSSGRVRFEREARVLAELHHPHVAEVYGFGEERGHLFLAMRLVDGASLLEVQGRLCPPGTPGPPALAARRRTVAWGAEVASALAAIHARGVIHRDVKASNVLVDGAPGPDGLPQGGAVLVDFGLARPLDASAVTRTGQAVATPQYAPPEQLLGLDVDARADVFALGVTLHDLLAGRRPGDRTQASAGLEPLATLVPGIDPDLAAVVDRACEREARWRYADGSALHDDLRAWLAGGAVSARRRSWTERVSRWVRGHPRAFLRAAAAVVALALAVASLVALGGWLGSAARARAAWRAGDLARVAGVAGSLPAALRGPLLGDRELVEAVERLASGADDPLRRVARAMDEEDAEGAFRTAATELEGHGLAGEPALARFFLASLSADAEPGRRSVALRYAARLFYERPVVDAEQREAARPWREALLELRRTGGSSEEDALFTLSALSGCADPGDVAALLAATLAQPLGTECRRLGELACERILRRGASTGALAGVDLAAILAQLGPSIADVAASRETGVWDEHGYRFLALFKAFAFAQQARGGRLELGPFLPRGWLEDLEARRPLPWLARALFALARDPKLVAWIGSGDFAQVHRTGARELGSYCAWIGDPDLDARVRARLAADGTVELAAFDAALDDAAKERGGQAPAWRPDPDTHLVFDRGPRRPVALPSAPRPAPAGVVAAWDFVGEAVALEGFAVGATTAFGRVEGDAQGHYLLLSQSGFSEVRLSYEVAEGTSLPWAELALDHIDAARGYYPYLGWVALRIEWDGEVLQGERRIDGFDRLGRSLLEVVPRYLTPGRHEIVLRLHPRTNTTYRLLRAELRPSDDLPAYRDGRPRGGERR